MFSWSGKQNNKVYESVTEGLQSVYKEKLLPLEKEYGFHDFHSPKLEVHCQRLDFQWPEFTLT